MLKKVTQYVKKYHMLEAEDTVLVGVSGGADSVCLLLLLCELKEEIPFTLLVAHVNHLIRQEAVEDADFVRKLCIKYEIPFYLVEKDVQALADKEGISTEEAGRLVRYQAFESILKEQAGEALEQGKAKIAVAHNLNDRAETMLFHLFRGTGLSGLGSIRPVKQRQDAITIIRPLLCAKRSEIENFLLKKEMNWCIDRTNDEDTYTRNRIRHHILPFAEEEISGGAVTNMGRAADILAEAEDFVQKEMQKAYTVCTVECTSSAGEGVQFSVRRFLEYHSLLQKQMILHCLENMTPARKDITSAHVEDIRELFEREGNRQISLPYGLTARREYEKVVIERANVQSAERFDNIPVYLQKSGQKPFRVALPDGRALEFMIFPYEKTMEIPQNEYTKWFDCDKIEQSLEIRARQVGDYFTYNTALSKKTLQDYMVEAKIPKQLRDSIPVLAAGSHVLWIVGYRISSYYKVDHQTKCILQVQIRGGQ